MEPIRSRASATTAVRSHRRWTRKIGGNKLTVTPDAITLEFKDKRALVIPPKSVSSLCYGQEAHRRVGTMVALEGVTGAPVSVAEKEREFLPVGVTVSITKDSPQAADASKAGPAPEADSATGTVSLTTTPDGAEVYVDGQFYGNSPATLKLKPGKHTIGVKLSGYKD